MAEADRRQILALLREQEAAIAAGDAAAVVAAMAKDTVTYDLPPPLECRGDAARSTRSLEQWFET